MTTKTMTTTAAAEISPSAPRRRAGRPHKTQGALKPPAPKRGRRPIVDQVRPAREADLDWLLLNTCGLMDRLASRRYILE